MSSGLARIIFVVLLFVGVSGNGFSQTSLSLLETEAVSIWYFGYLNDHIGNKDKDYSILWLWYQIRGLEYTCKVLTFDLNIEFREQHVIVPLTVEGVGNECPAIYAHATTGDRGIDLRKYFDLNTATQMNKSSKEVKVSIEGYKFYEK